MDSTEIRRPFFYWTWSFGRVLSAVDRSDAGRGRGLFFRENGQSFWSAVHP